MAEYVWNVTAQQWREDPYYVGSSYPVQKLEVVAEGKGEAIAEARRALGPAVPGRYWRIWIGQGADTRLVMPGRGPA